MDRYPSTPHLPFSPEVRHNSQTHSAASIARRSFTFPPVLVVQVADDDSLLPDADHFVGMEVVISEKLDGGNCCLKDGEVLARTHSKPATHASFSPIKALMASWRPMFGSGGLYEGHAVFGENMTGIHSIEYDDLESYFYVFGVQGPDGRCFSWDEVEEVATTLGVPTVPVYFRGRLDSMEQVKSMMERWAGEPSRVSAGAVRPEGFVIRTVEGFPREEFDRNVAKYVRRGHIQTDDTWLRTWKKAKLHAHRSEDPTAGAPAAAAQGGGRRGRGRGR